MNIFKLLALSFSVFLVSFSFGQENWTLKKDKNGIKVYTKVQEGQNLKASKAEMVVNANVTRILEVLNDVPKYIDWTPKTESAKLLKRLDKNNYYYYTTIKAPMVTNRDLVVKVQISTSAKITTVTMKGVPNYIAKSENYVRMPSYLGVYKLTALSNGETKIQLEYAADPGGDLPSWLVNTAAVDVPFDIFNNLREIF